MGNRTRLGVAVLFDPPVADAIDGLRRALGDPSFGRMAPHVTLVPPVNVRTTELPAALRRLRAAASVTESLCLTVGAPATFLPANPVLYLSVGGDLEGLGAVRDAVFAPPLDRKLSWPWVPHVTLIDGGDPETVETAAGLLGGYSEVADVDRIVLLEERRPDPAGAAPPSQGRERAVGGRVWHPLADVNLGRPARVGTGGLLVEIVSGRLIDPELAGLAAAAGEELPDAPAAVLCPPIVLTAHREGAPVGTAVGWIDRHGTGAAVYVLPQHRRQGIAGQLLRGLRRYSKGTDE